MSKLDAIRNHRDLIERGYAPDPDDLLEWYRQDIAALLQFADAVLGYREAVQVPDGVAAAEQALFGVLEQLEAGESK